MFGNLFKSRLETGLARELYDSGVRAARQEGHYRNDAVPDTLEGRLEMVMLHTALIIRELNASGGDEGKALAQDVFDVMFDDFDAAMREMGVGDSAVGKKIRFMAEGFYGRASAYGEALDGKGEESLNAILARNVLAGEDKPNVENELALYVKKSAEILSAQGFEGLKSDGEGRFAEAVAQS
ncbi:MAG: ubiquinol-cytochrome C chaperone [Alphaproteobacteria bacterium]|nr:ubiquinol-cytochrome C chaperone [Alphaproteobacteria bacterium]